MKAELRKSGGDQTLECIFSLAILVTIVVITIIGIASTNASSNVWNRSYQAIAQKYGGASQAGGIAGRPAARFQYGQTACFLTNIKTRTRHGGPFTKLSIKWDDHRFRLEIFPSWRNTRLWKLSGMQEYEVGNKEFNERYHVRTNNKEMANAFFSDGVFWQIDRLRTFLNKDDIYVAINRGFLMIQKPTFIKGFTELDDFVRFGTELFDQAMLNRTTGIEFVQTTEAQVLEEVICQICGDQIRTDLVYCVRCKTPHCHECWQYYGQCSTFACGETRYVIPGRAGFHIDTSKH